MSYPKQIPRRSPIKPVVIQIGKQIIKKFHIDEQTSATFRTPLKDYTKEKQNSSQNRNAILSQRRIHQIHKSPKPKPKKVIDDPQDDQNDNLQKVQLKGVQQKNSVKREIHEMISDLLRTKQKQNKFNENNEQKKSSKVKKRKSKKNKQDIPLQRTETNNTIIIKRIVNDNYKKISTTLPFTNLDLLFPEWWHYYEGESINNKKSGHGTLYLTNGEKFTGKFEDDKANGNGTFYKNNGMIVIGIWRNNQIIKRIF